MLPPTFCADAVVPSVVKRQEKRTESTLRVGTADLPYSGGAAAPTWARIVAGLPPSLKLWRTAVALAKAVSPAARIRLRNVAETPSVHHHVVGPRAQDRDRGHPGGDCEQHTSVIRAGQKNAAFRSPRVGNRELHGEHNPLPEDVTRRKRQQSKPDELPDSPARHVRVRNDVVDPLAEERRSQPEHEAKRDPDAVFRESRIPWGAGDPADADGVGEKLQQRVDHERDGGAGRKRGRRVTDCRAHRRLILQFT